MADILRVGQIIDGTGQSPISDAVITVENGRIAGIAPYRTHADGSTVQHFPDLTLIPGCIDLHTHFCYLTDGEFQGSELRPNRAAMVKQGFEHARAWLEQGVTTARVVGTPFDLDIDLKEVIAKHPQLGPRLVTAGRMMTMTGGKRTPWDHMKDEISGPDEARRWVRSHIKEGADVIKLYCTTLLEEDVAVYLAQMLELPKGAPDPGRWASLTVDEIRATVEEAHKAGCTVAAHVAPAFGIKLALQGGVDTIEHGNGMDEECIDLFLETGATLVPTLSVSHHQIAHAQELALPDVYAKFAQRQWDDIKRGVRQAFAAGVPIATGTDAILPGMCYWTEPELLVECGLAPHDALRSATGQAAACLGSAGRQIGTLEPGKFADMVLLEGDPLADITNIRKVVAVYKEGEEVYRVDRPGS